MSSVDLETLELSNVEFSESSEVSEHAKSILEDIIRPKGPPSSSISDFYIFEKPIINIFPTSIVFPPTLAGFTSSKTVVFSNSSLNVAHLNLSIPMSYFFHLSDVSLEINPGETKQITITFTPNTVSLCQASIVVEGTTSSVISLTGHCIPSPLVVPPSDSPLFIFKDGECHYFDIFNRSITQSLSLDFSTSHGFEVKPQYTILDPSTTRKIMIQHLSGSQSDGYLIIECRETHESHEFSLRIKKDTKLKVSFGKVEIGKSVSKEVKFPVSSLIPDVTWPFRSLTNSGIKCDSGIFCFEPSNLGKFTNKVIFDDFTLVLEGTSIPQVQKVEIPTGSPKSSKSRSKDTQFYVEPTHLIFHNNCPVKRLSASLHITSNSDLDSPIKIPDFLKATKTDTGYSLELKEFHEDTKKGYVILNSGKVKVPVFAYNGTSDLRFHTLVPLTENRGQLLIRNVGNLPGFIFFTVSSQSKSIVELDPSSLVIQPGESVNVHILASTGFSDTITALFGDLPLVDFINELKSNDQPSQKNPKTRGSLLFESFRGFGSYFNQANIKLVSINQSEKITVSPSSIDFLNAEERKISISNFTKMLVDFSVSYDNQEVQVHPSEGAIEPFSEMTLSVHLMNPSSTIRILVGGQLFEIKANRKGKYSPKVSLELSSHAGALKRGRLKVSNRTHQKVTMTANTQPPFFCPIRVFEIEPSSYIYLPLHFIADEPGVYNGIVTISPEKANPYEIHVKGVCSFSEIQ